MNRLSQLLCISILALMPQLVCAQESYFRFIEKDKEKINTIITQTVSIDNIVDNTVYAYANAVELEKFKALGYDIEFLPHPSTPSKSRVMATTVEQMANWDRYPTYEVYRSMMKKFEKDYPQICKLDSFGTTVNGRKLYVIKISDNVLVNESEPEFFYSSTMHGDETTGYILMLRLIDYFLSNYGLDERVNNMVNNIAIYINPNANPDGTYRNGNNTVDYSTRYNANNVDLNRNFPDPRVGQNPDGNSTQVETLAMMNYAGSRNFVLSANFHGGIELVNYPWDTWKSTTNLHPDNSWFYTISRQYADLTQANSPAGYFTGMNNGVTHGGDWYVVAGGRQDYMNYWHNCREITLEISNTKNPASADLPKFWDYNKEAMLTYIELLYSGVQGVVTNSLGNPLGATITISGHDKDNSQVVTNPLHGNYIRMIAPGSYNITYSASGYESKTVNSVPVTNGNLSIVDVVLGGNSSSISLNGLVLDYLTLQPIATAAVSITSSTGVYNVETNVDGEFIVNDFSLGLIRAEISAVGYFDSFFYQNVSTPNVTFNIVKTPRYSITFNVKDELGGEVEGASITIGSVAKSTDENGVALFADNIKGTYSYQIDFDGYNQIQNEVYVSEDIDINVSLVPLGQSVSGNRINNFRAWPNPFSSRLTIELDLLSGSNLNVDVYSVTGQKVSTLASGFYPQGLHSFEWDVFKSNGMPVNQGVFIVRILSDGESKAYRVIFLPNHR
jgi:hypothetical protein